MSGFDHFVIFADMRTGSNLLEESLNAYDGITSHGEVFNPRFVGHAGDTELFGVTLAARDMDPLALVDRMKTQTPGLAGFRFFPGHDPRVFDHSLADRRCAKVILARNPVDSYVSLKIARETGQWWLGDAKTARSARVSFDASEFDTHLQRLQAFHGRIRHVLQTTGQTAFHVHYDDLSNAAVLDGLATFLGATPPADPSKRKARVQNPEPLSEKVLNFADMPAALARLDYFDLYRIPDFEPRRGPNIPGWMASDTLGLLYMPIAGGPTRRVAAWLEAAAGAMPNSGINQKQLRQWKRQTPGHRSFTVVTHPIRRAHDVFCEKVLDPGPDAFHEIRRALRGRYGLALPEGAPDAGYTRDRHREAFRGFLGFLKRNVSGQTSLRIPAVWSSQAGLVRALADFAAPDAILRAESLDRDLPNLTNGRSVRQADLEPDAEIGPFRLGDIYDSGIEAAGRAAYQRDYMTFGYGPWRPARP